MRIMTSSVLPPSKAGGGAVEHADHHRDEAGEQADGERDAPGHQRSGQEVAAGIVGAEQEILLLDRRRSSSCAARPATALDLGVVEGVGTVEIADVALVDRLGAT